MGWFTKNKGEPGVQVPVEENPTSPAVADALPASDTDSHKLHHDPAAAVAGTAVTQGDKPHITDPLQSPAAVEEPHREHSFADSVHTAKTATVSGLAVAALILWTIAVAGWTGFQVVWDALVWNELQGLSFTGKPASPDIPNNGYPGINHMELKALWALVAIESVLLVSFLVSAIVMLWVPLIGACRQKRVARRMKRSFLPWLITLILVAAAWFKLFTLSSILNKMAYQGIWCTKGDNLDIGQTFKPSGDAPSCSTTPLNGRLRMAMVWAMLTIAFHMLMYFLRQPKGIFGKLFGFLPVVLVCALLVLKPVTSLMNMYYTQNAFTREGNFTFTAEIIVALIEFITAVWLSLYMGWAVHSLRLLPRLTNTLLGCCGKKYEDVYYEHEVDDSHRRGSRSRSKGEAAMEEGLAVKEDEATLRRRKSYNLRAAGKSVLQQYYYMTQLPSVFGFVSPMITYFALRVTNWWIVFDIIVGAALIFVYMVLCAFHRKVLSPSKHAATV